MATQTATILVSDLVGSTELRAALGEDRAEEVRRLHDRALVEVAERAGGIVVKGTGMYQDRKGILEPAEPEVRFPPKKIL